MKKVALKIAYIGTGFRGFQRQIDVPTVEGEIIKALIKTKHIEDPLKSAFSISGRTDKGVHSLGNVVAFNTEKEVIINEVNNLLPREVQIIGKTLANFGFKPRNALRRYYRYVMADFHGLDIKEMEQAARNLVGTHNFINFSKRSERNPIRKIEKVALSKNGNIIVIDVVGESFLWNMVRKMVRVLYQCGKGDLKSEQITDFLNPEASPNIKPMPAQGLILMDVEYENLNFVYDKYAVDQFITTLTEKFEKDFHRALVERHMFQSLGDIFGYSFNKYDL